jgi:tetratricopeptide (TPR) repeat protein
MLEGDEVAGDSHGAITELNEPISSVKELDADGDSGSVEKDDLSEVDRLIELGVMGQEQGNYDEAADFFERSLVIAKKCGDRARECNAVGRLGAVAWAMDQYPLAIERYIQAIEVAKECEDQSLEAHNLWNLGRVYSAQGHPEWIDEAAAAFRRAISMCDQGGTVAAGVFRGSLALLVAEQGQLDEAFELLKAGEVQVEVDAESRATLLSHKGRVQVVAGQIAAARRTLQQADEIAAALSVGADSEATMAVEQLRGVLADKPSNEGELSGHERVLENKEFEAQLVEVPTGSGAGSDAIIEGDSLIEMGNIERGLSNYVSAHASYDAALLLYHEHAHVSGEGVAHERLGSVCRIQGKHDEASQHFQHSLRLSRSIGDRQQEGVSLGGLATSLLDQGRFQAALEHYELALAIHRDLGDKRGEGTILGTMGITCAAQGHVDIALEHFEAALAIQVAIGDKPAQGLLHGNMANALRNTGQLHVAIGHYQRAIDILRVIGDRGNEGLTRGNLGLALHRLGKLDEARAMLEEAIQICGDSVPLAEGACCGSLAQIMAEQGDMTQAHRLLERGEPVLDGYREELGKFLCKKGVVQCLDSNPEAAQASLSQANEIAQELQVNERSELARAIAKLQAMM